MQCKFTKVFCTRQKEFYATGIQEKKKKKVKTPAKSVATRLLDVAYTLGKVLPTQETNYSGSQIIPFLISEVPEPHRFKRQNIHKENNFEDTSSLCKIIILVTARRVLWLAKTPTLTKLG